MVRRYKIICKPTKNALFLLAKQQLPKLAFMIRSPLYELIFNDVISENRHFHGAKMPFFT